MALTATKLHVSYNGHFLQTSEIKLQLIKEKNKQTFRGAKEFAQSHTVLSRQT